MLRRLLALLVLALPLQAVEVRVLAAASLTDALEKIAAGYKADQIVLQFGASSMLARQIEAGAPADLFLSADERTMNALAANKRIDPTTRVSMLSNTLVIMGSRRMHPRQLADKRIRSIALAEPSSVPAGIYARAYLEKLGIWDAVAPKVIPTENVRAALAAVDSGNADAAIVYKTDARMAKHAHVATKCRARTGRRSRIRSRSSRTPNIAPPRCAFLAYLQSPAARAVLPRVRLRSCRVAAMSGRSSASRCGRPRSQRSSSSRRGWRSHGCSRASAGAASRSSKRSSRCRW